MKKAGGSTAGFCCTGEKNFPADLKRVRAYDTMQLQTFILIKRTKKWDLTNRQSNSV